eukprot:11227222-Lingulodinium_polyedra.AAC.1
MQVEQAHRGLRASGEIKLWLAANWLRVAAETAYKAAAMIVSKARASSKRACSDRENQERT